MVQLPKFGLMGLTEGPNGKRQVYDFKAIVNWSGVNLKPRSRYYGPDVRWVGTESGYGRDSGGVLPIHDTAGLKGY